MTAPPRKAKITIRDVARAAGVSVGTASRVINKSGPVSARSITAVNAAIGRLDYNPDLVAQSLRRKRTNVIGCMIPDIANPVFAQLTKTLERVLQARGYILLIASSDMSIARELDILHLFRQRKVDGLIVSLSDEGDEALTGALRQAEVPIVALDRQLPVPSDAVLYEHAKAVSATVRYLVQLGHKRIALITGNSRISPTRERIEGYHQAHAALGLTPDAALIRDVGISERHGLDEASALLASPDPPTAIVAGANQILVGVLRAIRWARRSVPDHISLVSCDDTPVSELMTPPITVVRRDIPQWGRLSADLLLSRLTDSEQAALAPRVMRMPCDLLLRDSCAPPGQ